MDQDQDQVTEQGHQLIALRPHLVPVPETPDGLLMPTDPADIPQSERQLVSSPVPGPPRISPEAAANALYELFLANADRGDNAAHDHLITEIVSRIRTQQQHSR